MTLGNVPIGPQRHKEEMAGAQCRPSHSPESEPPSLPERRPPPMANPTHRRQVPARISIEIAIEGWIENRERIVELLGTWRGHQRPWII